MSWLGNVGGGRALRERETPYWEIMQQEIIVIQFKYISPSRWCLAMKVEKGAWVRGLSVLYSLFDVIAQQPEMPVLLSAFYREENRLREVKQFVQDHICRRIWIRTQV